MDEFEPLESPRSRLPLGLRLLLWLPVLLLGFYLGILWRGGSFERASSAPRPIADATLNESELATVELFREAAPAVVYITTLTRRRIPFSRYTTEVPSGTGSGFVWDENGHIVTNLHVLQNASKAVVTLGDQSEWDASLVGFAEEKDLAVLKIEAPADRLRPIPVGSSRDLRVGQSVYAIGNPFGLDQTLTTGVVSAVGREIEALNRRPIRDVIQTDAAINPGNSGGPLLDSSGRLIGVNTQIYSPSGASAGIGFAIPVDTVNRVVPDLIEYGQINRPVLGIDGVAVTYRPARSDRRLRAVLIEDLTPGLGAERAGLRPHSRMRGEEVGDLIVALEGQPIETMDDLALALEQFAPGDRITVTVLREDRRIDVEVELSSYRAVSRRR